MPVMRATNKLEESASGKMTGFIPPDPAEETAMSHLDIRSAIRPDPDQAMVDIANYVVDYQVESPEALATARYMLLDSLGCAMLAMKHPECVKHLGPLVPGASLPGGVRVPGTSFELDPVQAAYNIGVQVRWLDFNDTWLAAEWGHPSDNLGAILAVADYLSRKAEPRGRQAGSGAGCARGGDQGARNPGRLRVEEQLQPGGPRPRDPGAPGLDGGRHAHAGRWQGRRSSTPFPIAGSMAGRCVPIGMLRMRARARVGPLATLAGVR